MKRAGEAALWVVIVLATAIILLVIVYLSKAHASDEIQLPFGITCDLIRVKVAEHGRIASLRVGDPQRIFALRNSASQALPHQSAGSSGPAVAQPESSGCILPRLARRPNRRRASFVLGIDYGPLAQPSDARDDLISIEDLERVVAAINPI